MEQIIEIHLLPAKDGDCLLIQIGHEINLLVDTGYQATYTDYLRPLLNSLAAKGQKLDRCIITHVDADHISGAVKKLFPENQDAAQPQVIPIIQVWHNSYRHLPHTTESKFDGLTYSDGDIIDSLKAQGAAALDTEQHESAQQITGKQGSMLGALLLKYQYNWNTDAEQGAIMAPLTVALTPEVKCRILSPTPAKLGRLVSQWKSELTAMGFEAALDKDAPFDDALECWLLLEENSSVTTAQPIAEVIPQSAEYYLQTAFKEDNAPVNGSSIAFVLEANGKRILLLGDAHPSVIMQELHRLYADEPQPWWFDCIKLSHHGSFANNSPGLLSATDSDCYLISTNGGGGHHPDPETLAHIVTRSLSRTGCVRHIYCNYPTLNIQQFSQAKWQTKYHYAITIAPEGQVLVVGV